MRLQLSALYRENDINHDVLKPSSGDNQGGGVAIQAWHLKRAIPSIEMLCDVEAVPDGICLTEALWLISTQDLEARIESWAKLPALKILINNDVSILRFSRAITEQILDAADVLVTTSKYAQQMLSFFDKEIHLLYDPLDIDMFIPAVKSRSLYSSGQICYNKNPKMVTDIFNLLPASAGLAKNYIGSASVWGEGNDDATTLQTELESAADNLFDKVSYINTPSYYRSQWGCVMDSRYDFSSFCMMEAMLCGCWFFAGQHVLYDERPVLRFSTAEEAIELIIKQLEETPPDAGAVNEEARQHIVDRNSYDRFRANLTELIGNLYFYV